MRLIDADELIQYIEKVYDGYNLYDIVEHWKDLVNKQPTVDPWHYPDYGEYLTKPNLCIRYVDRSGDEFIGYTEWYYPSEDEVGYGNCVISVICNGVPVDDNDIKMWCELPYPPKEEDDKQSKKA